MHEIRPGVWHWKAWHPAWKPGDDWAPMVSSYALEDDGRLLLFDPLEAPEELLGLAAGHRATGREVAIVLTCPWHERGARDLALRLDVRIHTPPPDAGDPDPLTAEVFRAGDRLRIGVEAFLGKEPNDLVLWVPGRRALITGDTLVDLDAGLMLPTDWIDDLPPSVVLEGLRPLLELPIELILPTHGEPTDRSALERVLA
jgi:glyoxylase-like metal-dependent hydrolase (beta-lactamase superfamily II)